MDCYSRTSEQIRERTAVQEPFANLNEKGVRMDALLQFVIAVNYFIRLEIAWLNFSGSSIGMPSTRSA